MAQGEIINYLVANRGRTVDITELMRVIPANRYSISRALRKLRGQKNTPIIARPVKMGCFTKFLYMVK